MENNIENFENFFDIVRGNFLISRKYFQEFDENVVLVEGSFSNQLHKIRYMFVQVTFSLKLAADLFQWLQKFVIIACHFSILISLSLHRRFRLTLINYDNLILEEDSQIK